MVKKVKLKFRSIRSYFLSCVTSEFTSFLDFNDNGFIKVFDQR